MTSFSSPRSWLFALVSLTTSLSADISGDWNASKFVWNLGMGHLCDIKTPGYPCEDFQEELYDSVQFGDLVWVKGYHILEFLEKALPKISEPFVLVSNGQDPSLPQSIWHDKRVQDFLEDPRLIAWYTQNLYPVTPHKKLHPIPIGMNFHSLATKHCFGESIQTIEQQEKALYDLLSTLAETNSRQVMVYADFPQNDSLAYSPLRFFHRETRKSIHRQLASNPNVKFVLNPISRTELWKKKGRYAFSISPFGMGFDCHRTWEDLILGMIVIMKHSPHDQLFEGLPVVFVNSWHEITKANLDRWIKQYGDAFSNPEYREKLTNEYWIDKIRKHRDTVLQ